MNIAILTAGSRGDVEPYLALGAGLAAAGHDVRLGTHGLFEADAVAAGLDFATLEGDPRSLLDTPEARHWLASGRNPVKMIRRLVTLVEPMFDRYLRDAAIATRDADVVLFSMLGFPGYHLAEHRGVPAVAAWLQPFTPTRAFPGWFVSGRLGGSGVANLASHLAVEQLMWRSVARPVNRWRTEVLALGPVPASGPNPVARRRHMPVLYGFSPRVVARPPDWPPEVRITGYWFRDLSSEYRPPRALVDFLEAGPPPVYVGFGSRPERNAGELAHQVVDALRRGGRRGVLLTGWGGLQPGEAHDGVLVVDDVPHAWLFPRMAAVVHHGGAGTTAAALRAGVPSVVVPSFADQFFWGERVVALGCGVVLRRRRLDAATLASALGRATGDPAIRARAAALGGLIRSEDGVASAVRTTADIVAAPG